MQGVPSQLSQSNYQCVKAVAVSSVAWAGGQQCASIKFQWRDLSLLPGAWSDPSWIAGGQIWFIRWGPNPQQEMAQGWRGLLAFAHQGRSHSGTSSRSEETDEWEEHQAVSQLQTRYRKKEGMWPYDLQMWCAILLHLWRRLSRAKRHFCCGQPCACRIMPPLPPIPMMRPLVHRSIDVKRQRCFDNIISRILESSINWALERFARLSSLSARRAWPNHS